MHGGRMLRRSIGYMSLSRVCSRSVVPVYETHPQPRLTWPTMASSCRSVGLDRPIRQLRKERDSILESNILRLLELL
jgi:predicted nuclease with RNAse H fold